MTTLHWSDSRLEIHKVVVGPFENNVFVLRCKDTGDAVLIDAANEHEQLLELCSALGVRAPITRIDLISVRFGIYIAATKA